MNAWNYRYKYQQTNYLLGTGGLEYTQTLGSVRVSGVINLSNIYIHTLGLFKTVQ